MKHYEASFTRVGGQGVGDGWQTVNVSSDTPSDALSSFSRFQNSNVYEPEFDSEDNTSKISMELQSDTNNVFLTYIKYGLQDQTGRPTMFANSLIFNINDFVANPIEVLRIKSDNFRFNIESTKQSLSDIAQSNAFTVSEAVDALGLDQNKYLSLMQCVFHTFDAKTKATLHIICDCSEDTIRKVMFCIYSAMPFAFRRKLSFGTYNAQGSIQKTIIFDRKVKSNSDLYFNLKTGENNILTDAVLKKIERYEFIGFVPRYYNSADAISIEKSFSIIEDALTRFGNMQSTSLDLNKLAYDTALYETNDDYLMELSDEALSRRLNELLSVTASQYALLDEQINCTLGEAIERGILLNDIVSEKLCTRLEKTTSEALLDTGNAYTAVKIGHMSIQEGADFLFASYKERDSKAFLQIREALVTNAKGQEVLKKLYIEIIAPKIPLEEESIINFSIETGKLPFKADISNTLSALCNKFLKEKIRSVSSPSALMRDAQALLEKVFWAEPNVVIASIRNLQEEYWNVFSYKDLNLEMAMSYADIRLDKNPKSDVVFTCLQIWKYAERNDNESFQTALNDIFGAKSFSDDESTYVRESDRKIIIEKFVRAYLGLVTGQELRINELDTWLLLAELGKQDPVSFLIKNKILTTDLLKSDRLWDALYTATEQSQYLKSEKRKNVFIDKLDEYVCEKETDYEIASNMLKIIKDIERQTKKEYAEAEKVRKKEAGEDFLSKAKDFTSGIGGLFGKNKRDKK